MCLSRCLSKPFSGNQVCQSWSKVGENTYEKEQFCRIRLHLNELLWMFLWKNIFQIRAREWNAKYPLIHKTLANHWLHHSWASAILKSQRAFLHALRGIQYILCLSFNWISSFCSVKTTTTTTTKQRKRMQKNYANENWNNQLRLTGNVYARSKG